MIVVNLVDVANFDYKGEMRWDAKRGQCNDG
jgi:hypothetical protein